jgi:hypothetical protein
MTPELQADCLEALTASASEVAGTALDGASFESLGILEGYGSGHGAYLGLVAQDEPIQVGVVIDEPGCQTLTKSLLGMAPGDEDLSAADVSDAMCEIINMIAGGLKRRVTDRMRITLGLPIFVAGSPLPNQHQEVVGRVLQIGDVRVSMLLLTQRQDTPASRLGATPQTTRHAAAKKDHA